jgi:acyl-CoA thioesterase-1
MCKIKWLKIVWVAFAALLMVSCGGNAAKENKDAAAGAADEASGNKAPAKKYIIFFGNSLTAGYGIEPGEAFPALIQQRIDSLGLNYTVVNAGLSGETTAAGLSRVDWVIGQQPVDIFILELGGNDGLRGIEVAETKKNLTAIIEKVWAKHPNAAIILAGMMIPPNMGATYSNAFKAVFPAVAAETNVKLIPFILENVGGEKELNLEDGIHPTPEGHKLVRENVWAVLKDVVE